MEIKYYDRFRLEEILHLYQSVGWTNYLKRADILEEVYANSLCVLATYDGDSPLGIIRAIGDGLTIVFVQDIIVLPKYQRKGIGTKLLKAAIDKYRNVYQMELLTDNREKIKAFLSFCWIYRFRRYGLCRIHKNVNGGKILSQGTNARHHREGRQKLSSQLRAYFYFGFFKFQTKFQGVDG